MASKKTYRVAGFFAGILNTISYVLLIVGLSLAISAFGIMVANDVLALVKDGGELTVELTGETTPAEVGELLLEKEAIGYPWAFELFSKLKHVESFEEGTYHLDRSMDYNQMIAALRSDETTVSVVRVTIPEGYTLKDICALLVEKNVVKEKAFWQVANNYDFAHYMLKDVPMVENRLEGYLFPDTYDFYANSDKVNDEAHAVDVINKMLNNFVNKYTKAMKNLTEANGMTIADVVKVASLIEKEAKMSGERTTIAGVIYNRLESDNFPYLQIDASILYVTGHKEALTAEDLAMDTPYNLYTNSGLPPTAICNPGVACMMAAIQPENHKYYYYVAKPDGSHLFAKNLDGHNKNVADVAAGKYD